jgi:HK97 family phage major capsid protein
MSRVTRADVLALQDDILLKPIFKELESSTIALPLMRRVQDMPLYKSKIAVQDTLATAAWIDPPEQPTAQGNEPGYKTQTKSSWENKYLEIAEIAAVCVINDYTSTDISQLWSLNQEAIMNSIRAEIDKAILVGAKPNTTWPDPVITTAAAKSAYGFKVIRGTNADFLEDISSAMGAIEDCGYMPSDAIVLPAMRQHLRDLRDSNGQPLVIGATGNGTPQVYGMNLHYCKNGSFSAANAEMIIGDFTQAIYAFRNKMTIRMFDTGTVEDSHGSTKTNLLMQDAMALRVTFEMAWQIPNPINRVQETAAERYPFSIITAS